MPVLLAGCGKGSGEQTQGDNTPPKNSSVPSVKLSTGQLGAVRIGIARETAFPVEKQVTGSVSFTDDPAVIQAQSTLLGAVAAHNVAARELARVRALGDRNGISQKEQEQAASDEQTTAAALHAARDAVRALGKSDAEIDALIRSGRIASTLLAGAKWVIANVPESDSPQIRAGQRAKVNVLALPGAPFDGVVREVYSTVDPNSHRTTLRVLVKDPSNALRPGMLTDTEIEIQKPLMSLSVPENGVVREGDGTMTVWVTRDRATFQERVVHTGLREGGQVQILDGLKAGEQVVTNGAIFLDNLLQAPPSD